MHYTAPRPSPRQGKGGGQGKHRFSLAALVKAGAERDPSGMLAATSLIAKWWRDQVLNVVPELKFASDSKLQYTQMVLFFTATSYASPKSTTVKTGLNKKMTLFSSPSTNEC